MGTHRKKFNTHPKEREHTRNQVKDRESCGTALAFVRIHGLLHKTGAQHERYMRFESYHAKRGCLLRILSTIYMIWRTLTYQCQTVTTHWPAEEGRSKSTWVGGVRRSLGDMRVSWGWCWPPNVLQKRKRNTATPGSEKIWGDSHKLPRNARELEGLFHSSHVAMNISDIRMPDVLLSFQFMVEAYSCTASCSSTCHCYLALQFISSPRLAWG